MAGLRLTMFREGDRLVPAAEMFREDLQKIPEKREVVVNAVRSRSPEHLRFFFGKLRAIIKAGRWDGDTDSLLDYVKLGIGHSTTVVDQSSSIVSLEMLAIAARVAEKHAEGSEESRLARFVQSMAGPRVYLLPKSIAFESMGQDAFNDFNSRSDQFFAERLGVDAVALLEATTREAGGRRSPAAEAKMAVAETKAPPAEETVKGLRHLAVELGECMSLATVEGRWDELKGNPAVKALYKGAPEAVKAIVDAAKNKGNGKFDDRRFQAVVDEAVKAATTY